MTDINHQSIDFRRNLAMALTPTHLDLVIFPTEQCNFRCSYCYEDFEIGRMSEDTVAGIKSLINHRVKDLRTFRLSWFGGEPLLAKDLIFDISRHAKCECDKNGVNFLPGSITTNGYALSLPVLRELIALNQSVFQISLDGFCEVHDTTRKLVSGRGTFQKIWENLLDLQQSDENFSVLLRLHLTPDNLSSVELLIEEIKRLFLPDKRFAFVFKEVSNFGGPGCSELRTLKKSETESIIARLSRQLYGEVPPRENKDDIYICYAAKPNSLLIRANGSIGKCTVALSDPRNNVGRINRDGTLMIDNAAFSPWLRGFKTIDPKILSCPMHGMPD
jgi:uncharacterized protein